jgi:hypothetical protein
MCAGKRIIPDSDAEQEMRAFVEDCGCTIDSGLELGTCIRLSIASAPSIPRTEEVDGA